MVDVAFGLEERRAQVVPAVADQHLERGLVHDRRGQVGRDRRERDDLALDALGVRGQAVPPHPTLARFGGFPVEIREPPTLGDAVPAQLVAQIGIDQAGIRRVEVDIIDHEGLVVADRVEIIPGGAAVVPAHDPAPIEQQTLAEPGVQHPQIGGEHVIGVQTGQFGVAFRHPALRPVVQTGAGGERQTQRAVGEGPGLRQMLLKRESPTGLAVVVRHRGVGREIADVALVAGVEHMRVVQNVRDERQAVQRDAILLETVGERRAAGGAVGFAEHVLGRVPAAVLAQVGADERAEALDVAVHAPQFGLGLVQDGGEAGAGRVDEHQVADRQQGFGVVGERVGGGGHGVRVGHVDAFGRDGSQ